MKQTEMTRQQTKRIGYRLFWNVFAFSIVLTFTMTLVRAYVGYQEITSSLLQEIGEIQANDSKIMAESLWLLEDRSLQLQLEGILNRSYIEEVKILDGEEVIAAAGTIRSKKIVQREYRLERNYNNHQISLGTLVLTAGLDKAREDLLVHPQNLWVTSGSGRFPSV